MVFSAKFISGDLAAPPDPRAIPCLCLPTALGTVGESVTLDPGDDVIGTIGAGKAAAWVLGIHSGSGSRVEVCPAAATWTAPSGDLTKSGSGPDIAVATADGFSGAVDDWPNFKLTVSTAGALGVAAFDVSYDGTSTADTIIAPQEGPAILRGSVDMTGLSLATINDKTLVFTAPASKTLTFGSAPTSIQDAVDDFNTLAVAAPLAVSARIHETATGEQYFEIVSTAVGASAGITLDATSTGDATFGLSNTGVTGTAAVTTLPNTGIELTFDSDTYVLSETYAKAIVGPTATLASQIAAATAAGGNFSEHPFGYLVFAEQSSNVNAATLAGSIDTLVSGWAADPDAPKFVDFLVGTALHTASATKATNVANIAANDASFTAAIGNLAASKDRNFALDDCYADAPAGLPVGKMRRSAALAGAIRRSSLDRVGGNPAWHTVPLISLLAADGATYARDEASAATKLGDLTGKAWCLKSTSSGPGVVKFARCPTGAGSLSRFSDPGVVAIAHSIAAMIFAFTESWEGENMETDPESPKAATAEELAARQHALEAYLRPTVRPADKPPNISGELAIAVTAPTVLDDGDVTITAQANPLSLIRGVSLKFIATGSAITVQEA